MDILWNESRVHYCREKWGELEEHAQKVASLIWKIRFPKDYEPSFEIDLDWEDKGDQVYARYYWKGDNDVLLFPLSYLWESNIDVLEERAIVERKEARDKRVLEELERKRVATEVAERNNYERLKAKYEAWRVNND